MVRKVSKKCQIILFEWPLKSILVIINNFGHPILNKKSIFFSGDPKKVFFPSEEKKGDVN